MKQTLTNLAKGTVFAGALALGACAQYGRVEGLNGLDIRSYGQVKGLNGLCVNPDGCQTPEGFVYGGETKPRTVIEIEGFKDICLRLEGCVPYRFD